MPHEMKKRDNSVTGLNLSLQKIIFASNLSFIRKRKLFNVLKVQQQIEEIRNNFAICSQNN